MYKIQKLCTKKHVNTNCVNIFGVNMIDTALKSTVCSIFSCFSFLAINSSVNFFIYIIRGGKFREVILQVIGQSNLYNHPPSTAYLFLTKHIALLCQIVL